MPSKMKANAKPFPFFSLPSELRIRIYELVLSVPSPIDLTPTNYREIAPLLGVFLVSRRMHAEAYHVFYGCNTFRLFPVNGRFFHTKKPLTVRLAPKYRAALTSLDVRLGPGFTKPPRSWVVSAQLGLNDMVNVRLLKVFVEVDPASSDIFEGFRVSKVFYTQFSRDLIKGVFEQVKSIEDVEFDAFESVAPDCPLMQALLEECQAAGKKVLWGSQRGWFTTESDPILQLDQSMSLLHLGNESVVVH
ncbi:hypothetical protein EJ05DRAFT_478946 [Pseudovirgaria hyperparasitica]|uniref:F-box domain-containing protein n=1 Tax=Pseudovirgaria hyperparasitica TaxID=470096 RepID=A0A6A6VZN4_9PEZI|nr:uncharacterized protein EJ05DRAFT_478946 [Pseudovirgaria hyperparasitica]KAF2755140.1 hypothetical protein EJ05DRAFT_478946 [Pseudovirgaria hyperparasitica]